MIFRNIENESVESLFTGDYLKIEFHVDIAEDVDLKELLVGCAFEDSMQGFAVQWASDEMQQDFTRIRNGMFFLEIPHLDLRPNTYGLYVQISLGTTRQSDFCDALHGAAAITILSNGFFDKNILLRANRGHMAVMEARYTV